MGIQGRLLVALGAASGILGTVDAQGAVHVVDDDGGADFTEIQAAVDAAVDGDLVLVAEGEYAGFTIDAKALTVVAQEGAEVTVTNGADPTVTILVTNLGAGQRVLVQGIDVAPVTVGLGVPAPGLVPALHVLDCLGPVWIEDCSAMGNALGFPVTTLIANTGPGARVENSASATFVRCSFTGAGPQAVAGLGTSGHGLEAVDSGLCLYQSEAVGGEGVGGPAVFPGLGCISSETDAGDGVRVEGGFLFASGCSLEGGSGLQGSDGVDILSAGGNGGDGGRGLFVLDGSAQVHLQDTALIPGTGGSPGMSVGGDPVCSVGADGIPLEDPAAVVELLPGTSLELDAPSPLVENVSDSFVLQVEPGDFVFLGVGTVPTSIWIPNLLGVLKHELPGFWFPVGEAPGDGALSLPFEILELGPGTDFALLYWQTFVLRGGGAFFLGGPSAMVLLDQAFQ